MQLFDLLSPERIGLDLRATSRKRLLEMLSEHLLAGLSGVDARPLFQDLCERERKGTTGLGHGIAIPHARLADLTEPRAAALRLRKPVDFDAPDGEPVDLVFGLALPAASGQDHLPLLKQFAEQIRDDGYREALRAAETPRQMLRVMKEWQDDSDDD